MTTNDTIPEGIPVPVYFYTTDYPHRPTSGPSFRTLDEDYMPIQSLERAKALAEKHAVGGYHQNSCRTSYGVSYEIPHEGWAER